MKDLIKNAQFTIDAIEVSDLIGKLGIEIARLEGIDGSPALINDLMNITNKLLNRDHMPTSNEICEIDTILLKSRRLNK